MTTLRDRCKEMYQRLQRDAVLRQGSPVDNLMAFVIAEKGRAADAGLSETLPLCLYFGSERDREEFIAAVREWKPDIVAKRMP